MAGSSNRHTLLPNTLWGKGSDYIHEKPREQDIDKAKPIPAADTQSVEKGRPKKNSAPFHNKSSRFGIPIKPSPLIATAHGPKQDSNYRKFCKIDQAGPGVIAIQDVETFPVCLIKERRRGPKGSNVLKKAHHDNLVSLLDAFESEGSLHVVYEYEHLAVSLACAAGSVEFSEPDMATICREILHGVGYIHTALKIGHGSINCSNVILTHSGAIKIANIGDSFLENTGPSKDDLKAVGSILLYLGDRTNLLCESSRDVVTPPLSLSARAFIEKSGESSAGLLLKHEFLQLANPGGAWSLKRHYFDTLPVGIKIGDPVNKT